MKSKLEDKMAMVEGQVFYTTYGEKCIFLEKYNEHRAFDFICGKDGKFYSYNWHNVGEVSDEIQPEEVEKLRQAL